MIYQVDVSSQSAEEAFKQASSQWGHQGILIPCHDPLIFKVLRVLKNFMGHVEPDRVDDYYIAEGRWCIGRKNHRGDWTSDVDFDPHLQPFVSSIQMNTGGPRATVAGVMTVTSQNGQNYRVVRRFFFSSARDATLFKLTWGGQ